MQLFISFAIIVTALLSSAIQAVAHHPATDSGAAQGGPIRTISAETLPKRKAAFSFQAEYFDFQSFSDRELLGFAAAGFDVHSTESVLHLALLASYGVTEDLTLSLKLPYVRIEGIKESHADEPGEVHRHGNSDGIGDLSLFGQYRFLNSMDYQGSLLLGVKMPTGLTTAKDIDGTRFETEFQPGSGSWDPSIGVAFQKSMDRISFYSSLLYSFATDGAQATNLGDGFSYNAAAAYRLYSGDFACDLILEINGEFKQKQEIVGVSDPNSGGNLLMIAPGVRVRWNRLSAFVSPGFPVVQDLNGIQNDLSFAVLTGLNYAF